MTDSLVSAARAVQQQAYAPYSGYRVGAAVEADTGAVFAGCNVENASYGLTICAERAAVAAAVSAGVRRIRRAVVVTDSDPPAAPCGACRQVLSEFGADMTVEAVGPARTSRWSLRDLLPAAFGPEQLA
ncbi:MAG TPA: cytidine deaminase [Gemmatimonadales bacterium]|nr:cytidine deaminase [Gemmatimonadales bacterium]